MGTSLTNTGITFPDATTQTTAASAAFAAGTVMLFAQTSAPTGWTKDTSNYDGSAIRVVTGTASTGGSVAFTTAFASQSVAGTVGSTTATNQSTTQGGSISVTVSAGTLAVGAGTFAVGATTLSTTQIPSHAHSYTIANRADNRAASDGQVLFNTSGATTGATGGGGSHTHSLTGAPTLSGSPSVTSQTFTGSAHNHTQDAHNHSFSGTAINLAVKYVDVIRATKA